MKKDKVALCDSYYCNGFNVLSYTKMKVVDVPKGTFSCPTCKQALLWKSPNSFRARANGCVTKAKNIKVYDI